MHRHDWTRSEEEQRLWRYGYVDGHDGLVHRVKRDGTTVCGMGRAKCPLYTSFGPTTCFRCLVEKPWGDF
jgi:hypothetical protein